MKCISNKSFIKIKYVGLFSILIFSSLFLNSCGSKKNIPLKYDVYNTSDEYGLISVNGSSKITTFANDLCVVGTDNITLDNVNIADTEGAGLFDLNDKEVVYSMNMHKKLYPASTTKILTALLALKYGNLSDEITISKDAVDLPSDASLCHFSAGDKVTLEQALYGLLICSGNDAANAIAEHISGSVDNFATLMNEEAKSLGATNSHFVNPHGLHDEQHYTTVYDLYVIFQEVIKYDEFKKIINTKEFTANYSDANGKALTTTWSATNRYLTGKEEIPEGATVIGGKTGTTYDAGSCLVLLSENQNKDPYISIILKADGKTLLYAGMSDLLENIN